MEPNEQPRTRAGNRQREAVVQVLADAMADGQLTPAEFDERTRLLWATQYVDELVPLTADLNLPHTANPTGLSQPATAVSPSYSQSPSTSTGSGVASSMSFSMMGGSEKRGDWTVSSSHSAVSIMGETIVDFRDARLTCHETTVQTFALMASVIIIVPEHVRVVDDGTAIMGEFIVKDHASVTLGRADIAPDAPVLRVHGTSIMGGVEVIRAAQGAQV